MESFRTKESYQDGSDMLKARDFVDAQLYDSEDDVIQDALRHLLRSRADLRVKLAVHRYQSEEISLAKAAHLAGVSWAQMKDILLERGIQPRLGPETLEDARQEVEVLRKHFETQS
jgi:predicted HTH domain antitoxin